MALQGNIDSFSVVDVLRLLGSSGKTGRLLVEGDGVTASLWLADGYLAGASLGRDGAEPASADPAEVLFDVMRFSEGSFVFEADLLGGDLAAPVDVADAVDLATEAMDEWTAITDVVPTVRASLTLADDLPTATVEIDRDTWQAIRWIAAADRTAPATSGDLAATLGCPDLAAMRVARDLVEAGLVVVGPDVPPPMTGALLTDDGFASHDAVAPTDAFAEPFVQPLVEPFVEPFGDSPGDVAAGIGDASFAEPQAFVAPDAFAPPAPPADAFVGGAAPFDHAHLHRVAADPAEPVAPAPAASEPAAHQQPAPEPPFEPNADAAAVVDERDHVRSELHAIFGSVDPFAADRPAAAPPGAGTTEGGTEAGGLFGTGSGATTRPADEPEDPDADLARQLAMLSPRAAEAVASAETGGSLEDAERARVARFLGSV